MKERLPAEWPVYHEGKAKGVVRKKGGQFEAISVDFAKPIRRFISVELAEGYLKRDDYDTKTND